MNPKFDFYAKLSTLFTRALTPRRTPDFPRDLAEEIIAIYENNKDQISFSDVTLENLELWHGQIRNYRGGEDPGIEIAEEIATCCFEDLASQMRNMQVRHLHSSWKEKAGISDDLFVRARHSKYLGGKIGTITIVTDDIAGFHEFCKDPDKFIRMRGEVHFSAANEALDPE